MMGQTVPSMGSVSLSLSVLTEEPKKALLMSQRTLNREGPIADVGQTDNVIMP